MYRHVLVLTVSALAIGGCVQAAPGGGFNPGPQYASSQQIFNTMSNFSVVGSLSDGTSYCEYHAPSGQIYGRDTGPYQGTWQVSNADQICYSYPQDGIFNDCQYVAFQGNRATFYDASGQPFSGGNLVGGNVC
jgi:hypothetical protein